MQGTLTVFVSLWQHSTLASDVYIHDKILQSQVSAKHQNLRDRGYNKEVNRQPDTPEKHLHWVENVKQQQGIKIASESPNTYVLKQQLPNCC